MDASMLDLRNWLKRVEELGELRVVEGAHWRHELGGIMDVVREQSVVPALLFDSIVDHPPGYRVLSNPLHSLNRMALAIGLPLGHTEREYSNLWRERRKKLNPLPLRYVSEGPVLENVQRGDDVNVLTFPSPVWRELDGGRYVGTADNVVTRHPTEGWINVGTYRVMIVDERHVTVYMDPDRHGRLHRNAAFERGEPFPVVISAGHHPLLFLCAATSFWGGRERANEYEIAGGIRGEPLEVIRGEATGLPFPAHAEIVIEAIARPGDTHPEGPFAEFTGYYGSATRDEPLYEIQRIYYRDNPIILGDPPPNPQRRTTRSFGFFLGGQAWDELEAAGVPNVVGVAKHAVAGGGALAVVAIKQSYAGHAKQAGGIMALARSTGPGARYVVVVDDDIDPWDLGAVVWAIANRTEPSRDIDILRDCVSSALDPMLDPDDKERGIFYKSRAIINACRPYEWRDKFPPVHEMSAELRQLVLEKWGWAVHGEARGGERDGEALAPVPHPVHM